MRFHVSRLVGFVFCVSTMSGLGCDSRVPSSQVKVQEHQAQGEDHYIMVPLDGAKIFRNYCAACHGANGSGDGPAVGALNTRPPDLTTITRRNHGTFPTAHIRGIISGDDVVTAHGSREMPVWGPIFHQIENDQDMGYVRLQNVADYLKSIQQK